VPAADERWRCFIAVDLGEPARSAIARYLEDLRGRLPNVRWSRPDTLHLTVAFLGDVAATRIPGLSARLAAALDDAAAFTAHAIGVGAFPSLARPQVLWIGVAAAELAPLADRVQQACEREGFPRDQRPFRAHVTLGRIRARRRRDAAVLAFLTHDGSRDFGAAPIGEVALYRSQLGAGGARHAMLARFPLAGA